MVKDIPTITRHNNRCTTLAVGLNPARCDAAVWGVSTRRHWRTPSGAPLRIRDTPDGAQRSGDTLVDTGTGEVLARAKPNPVADAYDALSDDARRLAARGLPGAHAIAAL